MYAIKERPPHMCPQCEAELIVGWGMWDQKRDAWIRVQRADVWVFSKKPPTSDESEHEMYCCKDCMSKYALVGLY